MKEPLIVDFLEQFLAEHNLSRCPRPPSRTASVRSHISTNGNRSPSSSSRLSVRLSQAELLEYSHQQQRLVTSVPSSPTERKPSLSRPTSMTSLDAALNSMEVGDNTSTSNRNQISPTISSITSTMKQ
jgi:hypothetical protein